MKSIPHSETNTQEIVSAVRITDVWTALGGERPRHGRARAFWRPHADGLNVALDDAKGCWFDHARAEGGGVLDLVMHVRGGTRAEAYRWLAERFGLPLAEREMTPAERREWARRRRAAEREARPLARLALWWLQARLADLEDRKADAAAEDRIDTEAARELHRLQKLTPEGVIREYLRFKAEHPEECSGLVRIGRLWQQACEAAVRAVVNRLAREQQGAQNAA